MKNAFKINGIKRVSGFRRGCHTLLVALALLLVGPVPPAQGLETLDPPRWSVGLRWEVRVHQRFTVGGIGAEAQKRLTSLCAFKVERELLVDGLPAYSLAVECRSSGRTTACYRLFCTRDDLTVRRIEAYPQGWDGKKNIHWYRRDGRGPTVVTRGYVPLSMPVFGETDSTDFVYEHCINGPNGFRQNVSQTVVAHDDHKEVLLNDGRSSIRQNWFPGLPWPSTVTMNGGRIVAELLPVTVSEPQAVYPFGGGTPSLAVPDAIDHLDAFGPPRQGRWWPLSATISTPPWSADPAGDTPPKLLPESYASTPSWSGYWWPMLDSGSGERLWHDDGPLDKYDYYYRARTGAFPSPWATSWEYANHRTTDQKNTWWGHCNGWAAAAVIEAEPSAACWLEGIYFGVADKKGILTEWHNSTYADDVMGDRYYGPGDDLQDIYPYAFITALIQYIASQDEAIVLDLDCGEQVWNHPAYGYEIEEVQRSGNDALFACKVYYATDAVRTDFTGTWEKIAKYEFWCTVDAAGNPIPGPSSWSGDATSNHPDFLWHPGGGHGEGNPALTESFVHAIAGANPANFARIDIRHTYRGDLIVRLGAGYPADPDWVTTISNQEGDSFDNIALDVDIGAASAFLPPGASVPWFLEVIDTADGDTGWIEGFSIRYNGTTYGAINLPIAIGDHQSGYAYIGAAPSSCQAHIDIGHTYRGDLVVRLGVGPPTAPLWVTTVSNREGEGADDVIADVDIGAGQEYLPPSLSHPWFLEVTDHEELDTGTIRHFSINHNGQVYSSPDPPTPVNDLQTAYAFIRPTSATCNAHIAIQHTWRGDLVVRLGVGDPSDPIWETMVSNREGEDQDDLVIDVDICAAESYLPPSAAYPWFLEVADQEEGDQGTILEFSITFNGATFSAGGLPLTVPDLQTRTVLILDPDTCVAHLELRHTWRGDLIVRLGAGAPSSPDWVTTVSDREGGEADDLIREVNLGPALAYLPPSRLNRWFLEVSDMAEGDVGHVQEFLISCNGTVYRSPDPPVSILDGRTCCAYIPQGGRGAITGWLLPLLLD